MRSKLIDARADFRMLLNLVCLKESTILNPVVDDIECKSMSWEDIHFILLKDVVDCFKSKDALDSVLLAKLLLLTGNGNISDKSTMHKLHSCHLTTPILYLHWAPISEPEVELLMFQICFS